MNKLLASLLVGAFALSINTTVFAADADATAQADAGMTSTPVSKAPKAHTHTAKKVHHKHVHKVAK